MKLSIPPLQISDTEGFSDEKDIFKRKPFGETLLRLTTEVENELIFALDSQWGEGKTTFIKMWRGLLFEHNIRSIYFDAFANDYIVNPFSALSGEIYELAKELDVNKNKRKNYKESAIKVSKVLFKTGVKIGIKALTLGALDGNEIKDLGIDKDIADEASIVTDKFLSDKLDSYKTDKTLLVEFRNSLSELAEVVSGENKPLVFIIDELDRCRPTFALELLEKIKHIFSVPKIVFVLVMNREQLEEAVKCQYGSDINASQYLQKFVNVWCSLPKRKSLNQSDAKTYLWYLLEKHNYDARSRFQEALIKTLEEYIYHFSPSLRELEQIVVNLIIANITIFNMQDLDRLVIPFLAVIRVMHPSLFQKLQNNECNLNEIVDNLNLENLRVDWFEGKEEKHPITWILRYCMISDDELKKLPDGYFKDTGILKDWRKTIIPDKCNALSSFTV